MHFFCHTLTNSHININTQSHVSTHNVLKSRLEPVGRTGSTGTGEGSGSTITCFMFISKSKRIDRFLQKLS